jgi:hypothetical protein
MHRITSLQLQAKQGSAHVPVNCFTSRTTAATKLYSGHTVEQESTAHAFHVHFCTPHHYGHKTEKGSS